jgi:hypothetical protein
MDFARINILKKLGGICLSQYVTGIYEESL